MCQIELGKEQAQQFALDIFDVLIRDIKEWEKQSKLVEAEKNTERSAA